MVAASSGIPFMNSTATVCMPCATISRLSDCAQRLGFLEAARKGYYGGAALRVLLLDENVSRGMVARQRVNCS